MWYNIKRFIYTIRPLLWIPGVISGSFYGIVPLVQNIRLSEKAQMLWIISLVATVISIVIFWDEIYDRWTYYR